MGKKNLLFITTDQWRAEGLSLLDHPVVKTPNLDALAADGVTFKNHFAQCIPCGPSRASIYTGMYMQNHRSVENGTPLDARHTNIALEFRKLGYASSLVGYTDTTQDPRLFSPNDPDLRTYESILPGFKCLAMASEEFPEDWALWLEEKGYPVPDNPRDLYYKAVENYPGAEERGKTYSPSPYPKELSETAFVTYNAEKFIKKSAGKPWFLHMSYLKPHRPYLASEPYNKMYSPDKVPAFKRAPTIEEEAKQHPLLEYKLGQTLSTGFYSTEIYPRDDKSLKQLRATYYGLMTEVDDNIGRIIELLKKTGQYENTVIIFTSDHGAQLGDHHIIGQAPYFDQTFHVPLIISIPDKEEEMKRGSKVDAFTESIDILPTALNIFGGDIPVQCDGRSLLPFLHGSEPDNFRTEAHWEVDFRYDEPGTDFERSTLNVIRDNDYKYVYFAEMPDLLFEIKNDPNELFNLAEDPFYTKVMLKYAKKLLSWRMENDERTLTHLRAGPEGFSVQPKTYN
jgi:arylsulfatase A-like enzyme